MKDWHLLRSREGREIYVDAYAVLAVWNEGDGSRLWSFSAGYIALAGTAEQNAEELDVEPPVLEPDELHK